MMRPQTHLDMLATVDAPDQSTVVTVCGMDVTDKAAVDAVVRELHAARLAESLTE